MSKEGGEQFRIKRRQGFTVVPNAVLQDAELSIEARGFLGYIMSLPSDWVFRPAHLMKACRIGRDKYYRLVRELKDAGYLRVNRLHDEEGRFCGAEWEINETRRTTENPDTVKPDSGNPAPLLKNHSLEENDNTNSVPETAAETESGTFSLEVFEEFWSAHPRPSDRERTEKLFAEAIASGVDPNKIIAATKAYAHEHRDTQKRYVAMSPNWLAKRRWEDQATKAAGIGGKHTKSADRRALPPNSTRPCPHLRVCIPKGSFHEEQTDSRLKQLGYRPLREIGQLFGDGYDGIYRVPPSPADETAHRLFVRWAEWMTADCSKITKAEEAEHAEREQAKKRGGERRTQVDPPKF